MKYCTHCGNRLIYTVPENEDRERFFCPSCSTVHYQNPKVVCGTIPAYEDLILLCRRAIEPRYGMWTLPAGYLENGETLLECAVRESREEAGIQLENLRPYAVCNLVFVNQVYFFYTAALKNRKFTAGDESLEVRLFKPTEIPWTEIAFTVVSDVLSQYWRDMAAGEYPFRVFDIEPAAKIKPS